MKSVLVVWIILGVVVVSGAFGPAAGAEGTYCYSLARGPWPCLSAGVLEPEEILSVGPPTLVDESRPPPLRIRNPFVPEVATELPYPDPSQPGPLRIVNPYVARPGDPGVSAAAVMPLLPQVVYPAAMAPAASPPSSSQQ